LFYFQRFLFLAADLSQLFSVGFFLCDHIPDNDSQLSCRGDDSGNAPLPKHVPSEEGGKLMILVVAGSVDPSISVADHGYRPYQHIADLRDGEMLLTRLTHANSS